MLSFLKNNWKIISIIFLIISNLLCFWYFRKYPKEITKDKIVEKVIYKDKIIEVEKKDTNIDKIKERIVIRYVNKDNKPVEIIKTIAGETIIKKEIQEKLVDKLVYQDKEVIKERIIQNYKNWSLSLSAGLSIPLLFQDQSLGINQIHPVVIGIDISRRIFGDFKLGLHVDSFYTIGIIASLDF